VKRPDRRLAEAALWRAAKAESRAPAVIDWGAKQIPDWQSAIRQAGSLCYRAVYGKKRVHSIKS
jgi:hypothetical protein